MAKTFYNSDGRQASVWVREHLRRSVGVDAPQMRSGLVVAQCARQGADNTCVPLAVCSVNLDSNNVMKSGTDCYFTSAANSGNAHISVSAGESFRRATALFAARKLVSETWVNQKDEYLRPHED